MQSSIKTYEEEMKTSKEAVIKTQKGFLKKTGAFKLEGKRFIFLKCKEFFQALQVTSWNIRKKVENYKFKKYKTFVKAYIKMEKHIKFGDTEINKQRLHQPILIKDIDIIKIAISNKVSFSNKRSNYCIGYKDA